MLPGPQTGGSVALLTIGSWGADAVISGWDPHSLFDAQQVRLMKFDADDYGFAWRSNTDDQPKFGHVRRQRMSGR
jgi:hypothetical protein